VARPRLVEKPLRFHPKCCIVNGRSDGELVDFGVDYAGRDPHVYMKRGVVETAGKVCGMIDEGEANALRERVAELEEQLAERDTQLSELQPIDFEGLRGALADHGVLVTLGAPPTKEDSSNGNGADSQ